MPDSSPTVVLVHGAFSDTSGWLGVIDELQRLGLPVVAVANPLRGLASDAAYVASVADRIDGPVVMVGHSYGGALITVAGITDNVVGLVYVAAFILEKGESLAELVGRFPHSALSEHLRRETCTAPAGERVDEVSIVPEAFPAVFAADVSAPVARVLAAAQRPLAASAFEEKATAAAWHTKPAWALIAGADRTIHPDVERFGAERAGATVVQLDDASHAVAVSRPRDVANLILDAVRATS
ncbi:alpha/beta fold hydrolase [Streptomyces sp. VRA16 Mangrove soil]|uniref:alpha/beta fold hydrolase n=1 Tax=Streptomyces sp. VRA16 Mangrove soil TaxID=2817434 RepID=UPI001A9F2C48|nr:alpha/beta hydrolase [Streptomyces sp. VRA16 Mangrove soil]MBO1331822.1 alpha/beta hydrolase [Streptomyces sp. VRA16 Mangrove soil]